MEGQDQYPTLKTAKTFITTIQTTFQKRQGQKLAKQLKELYFTNSYSNVSSKNWNISVNSNSFAEYESNIGPTFAKLLQLIRDYQMLKSANKWVQCFEKHMQVIVTVIKILQDMKENREWLSKGLRVIVRSTKRIFLGAQKGVNNSGSASKLKNNLLNTLQRFKSARALAQDIKRDYLPLVDIMQTSILLSFHNYQQAQKLIYSPKMYGQVGPRYNDNFLFQKGKYALVNENLKEAQQCFSRITIKTRSQKKLVLRYLIPCKMLLGHMFQARDETEAYEYSEYISIQKAIIQSDFKAHDELNKKYQKVWLKRGIYLLMDRMRILLWRNLIKRLSMLADPKNKVQMQLIAKAVQLRGGHQDVNECICIVGNLIYEGYIKGYVFQSQNKRTLVLKSSGNAFPPLRNIAK